MLSPKATLPRCWLPVSMMNPKEGVETWCCGMILMKSAPHEDKAYDLIDLMLSLEAGEFQISLYGIGHSNSAAFDLISAATLAELQLPQDPSELLDSGVMYCKFRDKDNVISALRP